MHVPTLRDPGFIALIDEDPNGNFVLWMAAGLVMNAPVGTNSAGSSSIGRRAARSSIGLGPTRASMP